MNASTAVRLVGVSVLLAALVGPADWRETASAPPPAVAYPPGDKADDRTPAPHAFVGMWVTADGHIRQELLADGRYEEAGCGREKAYIGRYTVDGAHIDYVDDPGFTATGDGRDGVLYHEHLVLYRETDPRARGLATASGDRADGRDSRPRGQW